MADSKAQSLAKRTLNNLAAITGVRLWSGKAGDPNLEAAQGVEMSEFVSSDIVAEGSAIDYKALTPKGFAASVATTARKGIVEKSTDAEIPTETADKFLDSAKQPAMRAHWNKSITASGEPKSFTQQTNGDSYALNVALSDNKPDATVKTYQFCPFTRAANHIQVSGIVFSDAYGVHVLDNVYVAIDAPKFIFLGGSGLYIFMNTEVAPYILCQVAGVFVVSLTIRIL
jgi:hypothetical protein